MNTKTTIKTIKELTKSGYCYINSDINSANFPAPETVETEGYRIIPIDGYKSSEECLKIIADAGCRPANVYELALLRENRPEAFANEKWHVALGSVWTDADGHREVPLVFAYAGGDFKFNLSYWVGDWHSGYVLVCFCDKQPLETLAPSKELGSFDPSALSDEIAISHLKSNGYKVTKEF